MVRRKECEEREDGEAAGLEKKESKNIKKLCDGVAKTKNISEEDCNGSACIFSQRSEGRESRMFHPLLF